jgi:hypothetical protein
MANDARSLVYTDGRIASLERSGIDELVLTYRVYDEEPVRLRFTGVSAVQESPITYAESKLL